MATQDELRQRRAKLRQAFLDVATSREGLEVLATSARVVDADRRRRRRRRKAQR